MFCSNCGKQIADGSAFCSECGAKIIQTIPNTVNQPTADIPETPNPQTAAAPGNAAGTAAMQMPVYNPPEQPVNTKAQKQPKVKAPKPPKQQKPQKQPDMQNQPQIQQSQPELQTQQSAQQKQKKLPTWAIVAIAAGGAFVLIILIILIIALAKIGQMKRELGGTDTNTSTNVSNGHADISDMDYIPAGVSNEEAHAGYIKFLKAMTTGDKDENIWSSYTVYDMNDDGVDELVAIIGSQDFERTLYIATYCDGGLIYFDDMNGVGALPCGDPNGGLVIYSFIYVDDDDCTESAVRYLISGDELYDEVLIEEHKGGLYDFNGLDYETYDLEMYKLDDLTPLGGSAPSTGADDIDDDLDDSGAMQSDNGQSSDAGQASDAVALTQDEIDFFTEYVQRYDVYGFICSSYKVPAEADIEQVFYNGANIGTTDISSKEVDAYKKATGDEIWGDLMKISASDIDDFLIEKVGLYYSQMENQFDDDWVYLADYDAYYFQRGDTNYQPFECASGTKKGNIYTLDIVNWNQKPFATFQINKVRDDKYMILNNEIIFGK